MRSEINKQIVKTRKADKLRYYLILAKYYTEKRSKTKLFKMEDVWSFKSYTITALVSPKFSWNI